MIKQPGSPMCFVCGVHNPIGLHAEFFLEEDKVVTVYTPQEAHQGYPGVMHGGLIMALLDETIGRTAFLHNLWVVTAKLEIAFRRPVPVGEPLRVVAEVVRVTTRGMEAKGTLYLADGTPAVEATGLFLRLPEKERQAMEIAFFGRTSVPGSTIDLPE